MATPARSPLLGYNHNVRYRGHIFHVQTEDSGPGNPHLFTHLFSQGSILASKRTEYDPETPDDDVRGLMQGQHKAILKELKQGAYDDRIVRFLELRGESFESRDPQTQDASSVSAEIPVAPAAQPDEPAPTSEAPQPAPEMELVAEPPAESEAPHEEPPSFHEPLPIAAEADSVMENAEAPVPAVAAVLDLDAVQTPPVELPPTPEPLPIHAVQPAVPGPGTYTMRRPRREAVIEPTPTPTPRPIAVRQPPVQPMAPIVIQRQVIVGAGGAPVTAPRKPSTTPVRRRPVSGGPYVVKEGSHADIVGATSSRRPAPPAGSATAPGEAPRTADPPRASGDGTPNVLVTDQSLDDVILAYLSQGERKG